MRTPDFWTSRGFAARLLTPLGMLYGASVAWKLRLARPYRATATVICIGNLTAGGSGKTPVAIAVAQAMIARGKKVFFLTRGYGGRERGPAQVIVDSGVNGHSAAEMGDEALLLARIAPTIVARDRAEGAALATARGAQVIVMDDGYQNFTLAKDLSLVVVDDESGFGNGLMLPAGPLREPVQQGLARADAVVVMGGSDPARYLTDLAPFGGLLLTAKLTQQDRTLAGKRVFAFAGIGRPEKFIASLHEAGAIVTGRQFFPDHHPFRPHEIADLRARAGDATLVTTEKDFVRLAASQRGDIATLKVAATFAEPAALTALLDRLGP